MLGSFASGVLLARLRLPLYSSYMFLRSLSTVSSRAIDFFT